jgi:23S rRNA (adenine2030-N6)-methyltransferase
LALKREFAGDPAVEVRQEDGYHAMKASLPPPERRGLVLIDPPFEQADEFERLSRALRHGLRRFATGCYAIWYPIKDEEPVAFVEALAGLKLVRLELRLGRSVEPGKLAACGLAVVNPPWKFEEAMGVALPWMADRLGADVSATVDARPARGPAPASGA